MQGLVDHTAYGGFHESVVQRVVALQIRSSVEEVEICYPLTGNERQGSASLVAQRIS